MKRVPFKKSSTASIGIELEYQLIDPQSMELISRAKELIRIINESDFESRIKPEITQCMIEINTSVHQSPDTLLSELLEMQEFMLAQAKELGIAICGGGTHPFQRWSMQRIFPTPRYKKLARKYRFLSKRGTVFGQHIHVGCPEGEAAIYLTHALIRYVPQFIALCASSPFYQGIDTGFVSTRSTVFNAFPLHGVMPWFLSWKEFSSYFYKMRNWGIINTMKDFYWDIRPKPEFGTVEIRVTDTPLSIEKAVLITGYVQALAHYLLAERPIDITHDLYYLYETNRFEASRYGFDGHCMDPHTFELSPIHEDMLLTLQKIAPYAEKLHSTDVLAKIKDIVIQKQCDALDLRKVYKDTKSFSKVVAEQCNRWRKHEK